MPTPRPAHLAPALAAIAVLVGSTPAPAREISSAPIYTLTCNKVGLPLHVSANGVVVDRSDTQESSAVGAPLNAWLRPGKNPLRFRTPPGAKIAKDARVGCKVVRTNAGELVSTDDSAGKVVAAFEWPAKGKKPGASVDASVDLTIAPKDAPPCELWTKAEKLTLDAPTRAAIVKVVGDFEAALRAGDADRVLALQKFTGEDWCRCFGKDLEEFRRHAPEQIRAVVAVLKDKKFETWNPARAKVELVAGGSVARVTIDGGPPIAVVGKEPGDRSTFEPFVAKMNGAFVLVR